MLRNSSISSKLRHVRTKRQPGSIYNVACNFSHKFPKNIEDDGYGHFEHDSVWDKLVEGHLGKRPDPGALILVRHGKEQKDILKLNLNFYF